MKGLFAAALTLATAALLRSYPGHRWDSRMRRLSRRILSWRTELLESLPWQRCPRPPGRDTGNVVALGRCRYVGTNLFLINNAYGGIAGDRIIGGPDWIRSLPFSIHAKAE